MKVQSLLCNFFDGDIIFSFPFNYFAIQFFFLQKSSNLHAVCLINTFLLPLIVFFVF